MVIKINKFPILRAEVQMYNEVVEATIDLIEDHLQEYEDLTNRIEEIQAKLLKIKTVDCSKGNQIGGGAATNTDSKYLALINEQMRLEKILNQKFIAGTDIVNEFNADYLEELDYWCNRIETVEYYLGLLSHDDYGFIYDLYINKELDGKTDKVNTLCDKYLIGNPGHLYRKSKTILQKIL